MKRINKIILLGCITICTCLSTCGAAFDNSVSSYKTILQKSLFVGDSFTIRLDDYKKEMKSEVVAKAGGTTTEIKNLEFPNEKPERVIILTGLNDLQKEQEKINIDEEILLINKLRAKYGSTCDIYIQAVFPIKAEIEGINQFVTNEYIEIYNLMLEYYCMNIDNVFYIDTRTSFIDKSGFLLNDEDGIHINQDFNLRWLQNIAMEVNEIEE